MQEINSLNITIDESEKKIIEVIEELSERTEYLCTAEACALQANLI